MTVNFLISIVCFKKYVDIDGPISKVEMHCSLYSLILNCMTIIIAVLFDFWWIDMDFPHLPQSFLY